VCRIAWAEKRGSGTWPSIRFKKKSKSRKEIYPISDINSENQNNLRKSDFMRTIL
jgi:hypothetical protein